MSGRIVKQRHRPLNNAARERSRVQSLRAAFLELQRSLPSVPPDTKLSKLDILVLATAYIYHLTTTLKEQTEANDKDNVFRRSSLGPTSAHFKTLKSATGKDDESDTTLTVGLPSNQRDSIFKIQDHHVGLRLKLSGAENHYYPKETLLHVNSDSRNKSIDPCLSQFVGIRQYHGQSAADQNRGFDKTNSLKDYCNCQPSGSRPYLLTGRRGTVGIMHPVKKWPMRYRLYQQILGCRPPS